MTAAKEVDSCFQPGLEDFFYSFSETVFLFLSFKILLFYRLFKRFLRFQRFFLGFYVLRFK